MQLIGIGDCDEHGLLRGRKREKCDQLGGAAYVFTFF